MTMGLCFVFCLLFMCYLTLAAVIPNERNGVIVSYDYKNYGRGNYHFSYVTSNGIERNETGQLVDAGEENEHIVVKGFFSYTDFDGKYRKFEYTADENGYRVNLKPVKIDVPKYESEVLDNRISGTPPEVILSLLGG